GGSSGASANAQAYTPATPQQQASDAEIILLAMIDAAKADGQIDSEEFRKITDSLKNSGVGQEGMNYVLQKLQGPMETAKIVSATRGRPDLAAQIYSASLMAIEVDTDAEKIYLSKLANALGLSPQVIQNIEQLTGSNSKEYMC
ncbi:MAG: tellurite resistance TerB family protein, partial [Synergistaceae bacterium]|nr:tellurite resistance TerB family protein [Synergistaceae bacterium]